MQINGINSTQSAANFKGIFNRRKKQESSSYNTNPQDANDSFVRQSEEGGRKKSKFASIKARATAVVMAALMAISPVQVKAADNKPEEGTTQATATAEATDPTTSEFLSKISDEQWAEFTSEELLDMADAINGGSQDIDLDKIGDGSNVQINSGDIDAEFGDDATLAWINGSENIAIDDSDVYDIYGTGSSADCEDTDGEDKNIQINEGDISGKFGDDATLAWINGSKKCCY